MKRFWKWLAVAVPSVALVVPLAPLVYVLAGGGMFGSLACMGLGWITYWCVSTVLGNLLLGYRWVRDRNKPVEDTRLRVPEHTSYEIDWTKLDRDGKL